MSSHHFVKEDQEPAVLFLDSSSLAEGNILDLLEWSPRVIAWESCIDDLIAYGVNIDQVYTRDPDLWNQHHFNAYYCKSALLVVDALLEQEENKEISALNIVASKAMTNKLIHEILVDASDTLITLFDHEFKHEVSKGKFEKWMTKDNELIISSLDKELRLNTFGFTETLHNQNVSSNIQLFVAKDGLVTIEIANDQRALISTRL